MTEPETYYAGSYWLARPESAEACAHRAEHFFHLLGHCDAAWNQWHDTAEETSDNAIKPDAATFLRMFQKKEQSDQDSFRFSFFMGDTVPEATSVRGNCGSATPWVTSNTVMTLPSEGPVSERVLTATVMTNTLRAMALAWEPEFGVATSHAHRDMLVDRKGVGTFVGWVMYFSRQRGAVPPLPAPVRVEPVEDKGTLVILTPERFTASNPEHVALAARVHDVLHGAGLLRPLQPFSAT